jgi:solute carrier family 35, member E1
VVAYRLVFDIRYPLTTYLSLIPLTLGVMLACSASFKGNFIGILYAFLAAIIFVTQNIFSKRLFNEAAKAEADGQHQQSRRLDKLNLLCYSSGLAFLLTAPLWLFGEGFALISDFLHDGALDLENSTSPASFDHGRLTLEFIFNGTFHFGQNIIAFVLLSMVSPVTYSVASLIKRVFVVVIAIIWFQNATTPIQGFGIALTFFGLYLYDRTGHSNKADRKARLLDIKEQALLPITEQSGDVESQMEPQSVSSASNPYINGYNCVPEGNRLRSESESVRGRPGVTGPPWVPPTTRPEERWPREDVRAA